MTSTAAEPVAITARVRSEAHLLLDNALNSDDPEPAAYAQGAFVGFTIAAGLSDREPLDDARRFPYATASAFGSYYRPAWMPDDLAKLARACGVRWGYKQATSEHPESDECPTCSERLITDLDEYETCGAELTARFCDWECHQAFHAGRACPAADPADD